MPFFKKESMHVLIFMHCACTHMHEKFVDWNQFMKICHFLKKRKACMYWSSWIAHAFTCTKSKEIIHLTVANQQFWLSKSYPHPKEIDDVMINKYGNIFYYLTQPLYPDTISLPLSLIYTHAPSAFKVVALSWVIWWEILYVCVHMFVAR
jgi:hypothetical protein